MLKKMLTDPPIKKIDLVWPLGLHVTARNLHGVTIKDALDAIYKQFKKKVRCLFLLARPFLLVMCSEANPLCSKTTSLTSRTSRASSGTAKSATPASSCTIRRPATSP